MSSEHAIFLFDGAPKNHMKVCLQSLRMHNKKCKIYFYYRNPLFKILLRNLDINFFKIDDKISKGRPQFYKIVMTNNLISGLKHNDKVLVLDNDLLFQKDPFEMFSEYPNFDFYYTRCIMSKPDSLRPEKIWKSVKYSVNGGVYGINVSTTSIDLMRFWTDNLFNESWKEWIDFELRINHSINGKTDLKWFIDQDFLNCIDHHDVPLSTSLRKIDVGYKYNYFTSTWGHFNTDLNMGNKIGDDNYAVIHFKGNFKDTYNVDNPRIYNMDNILNGGDLTTKASRERIYKKFLSRGKARFDLV